jgi:hypothetical protein
MTSFGMIDRSAVFCVIMRAGSSLVSILRIAIEHRPIAYRLSVMVKKCKPTNEERYTYNIFGMLKNKTNDVWIQETINPSASFYCNPGWLTQ